MKKMLALLLTLAMLLVSFSAAAEEAAAEESGLKTKPVPVRGDNESMPLLRDRYGDPLEETEDIVTVDGDHYTIVTPEEIRLDVQVPKGYVLFTQDVYASADAYRSYRFYENMIYFNMRLYFYDPVGSGSLYFIISEEDNLSSLIYDIGDTREDQLISLGKSYAKAEGETFNDIIRTETNIWLRYGSTEMMTIVGGHCIFVHWGNEDYDSQVVDEPDLEEIRLLLSAVTVSQYEPDPASADTDHANEE